jgi:PAS domain S-box-containing protein
MISPTLHSRDEISGPASQATLRAVRGNAVGAVDARRILIPILSYNRTPEEIIPSVHGHPSCAAHDVAGGGTVKMASWRTERGPLAHALAAVSDGVVVTDPNLPDNPVVYVNPCFERMTGYAAEEVVGRNCRFLHGEDRDQPALQELRGALKEGRGCRVVLRNYRKDGSLFWNELEVTPVRDDDGRLTHFVGVFRTAVEHQHEEGANGDNGVLESITDAFVAVDREWRFTYLNERATLALRRTRAELLGKNMWEEFPEALGLPAYREYHRAMTSGNSVHFEEFNPWLGIWVEVHAYPSESGLAVYFRDISERKQAEERLREAEERYRALVEQIPAVTYIQKIGQSSESTYVSPQMETMLGYKPEECTSDPEHWIKIMHPADRERVLAEDARTNESGEPFRMEFRQFAKDGSVVWIRDEAVLVRDEEGAPSYWLGIQYDITERKRAEERLAYQLNLTETITDNAADPLFMTDARGRVTFMNPAAEQTFGWNREELLGRVLHEQIHHHRPDGRPYPASECPVGRVIVSERTLRDHEDVFFRKDGSTVDVVCSNAAIVVDGKITGAVLVVHDVTERKRVERALKESDARLGTIFEGAAIGITLMDRSGRILESNPALRTMLGYGEEELRGTLFTAFTHPDDAATDTKLFRELLVGERDGYELEKRYLRKDGRVVWARLSGSLVSDSEGKWRYAIGMVEDITERKRAEQEMEEIRIAERRRLARDLHDVVLQDLASVVQAMQAARRRAAAVGADSFFDEEIDALRRSAKEVRETVLELRSDRPEGQRPFVKTIEALVKSNRDMAPERTMRLEVREGFPPELPERIGVELRRIIREALTNARRHSYARRVEVVLSAGHREVCAEVADDGVGFDPASVREGVGLAGMRERVTELDGELEVESGIGEGTVVRARVPVGQELA